MQTQPIFLIGTGRSGTRAIFKLLSGVEDIEIYHEYLCTHIQSVSCLYSMGQMDRKQVIQEFEQLHGAAIQYSSSPTWIDCSNKLSWIIDPIKELLPNAKFVNIVRDGRKVVSSYYHKLADEMYDDVSVAALYDWMDAKSLNQSQVQPPPEKKYWWNLPKKDSEFYETFRTYNRFQRICQHWVNCNQVVKQSLQEINSDDHRTYRLEDLTSSKEQLADFLSFVGVEYEDLYYDLLQTPQNVIFPMDFKLSSEQLDQFAEIAEPMMAELKYLGTDEYSQKY